VRRLGRALLWTAGIAGLVAGLAFLAANGVLDAAAGVSSRWAVPLTVVRVGVIAGLWWWWMPLMERVPGLTAAGREYLAKRRHFYALALCAVEVLVVLNALGELWRWMD